MKTPNPHTSRMNHVGFTLVELSIVLLIVAVLLGGLLPTVSSQVEQRQINETRKQLDEIKEALIGFAVANGRLPCPATATSNGVESFAGGGTSANGNCFNFPSFYNGFLPSATLGINGAVNSQGLVIDSWGNPIRYAVSSWKPAATYVFTSTNGISVAGMSNLLPNLQVCKAASTSGTTCSVANSSLTPNGTPAVIYSTGKNGAYGGTGADEAENPNPNSTDNDAVFVSAPPTLSTTNGFDDIVIWLSTNVLVNRMVAAGQLP